MRIIPWRENLIESSNKGIWGHGWSRKPGLSRVVRNIQKWQSPKGKGSGRSPPFCPQPERRRLFRAWLSPGCLSGMTTPVWPPCPSALMWGDPTAQINGAFEERKPHVFCFLPILYSLQSVSHLFEEGLSLFYREDLRFRDGKWLTQGRGSALWQSHYISALPTDFYPNAHSHCWGQRSNGIFPKKSPYGGIKSGE